MDGDLSPSQVFVQCGGTHDHLAVNIAVWVHELTEAMKRHRTVWVSSRLTKNGYMIKDDRGLRELIKHGKIKMSGPRIAFTWALDQIPVNLPVQYTDDCLVPPSIDAAQPRGDAAARVDAFVDSRRICNTMMRDKEWIPENPFVLTPQKTERVPRYRLKEWQKLAELEGALFVGDTVGCVVTLRDAVPIKVQPHVVRHDMLVVNERDMMTCAAAQTQLRSVRIESYADLLTKLPYGVRFPAVYAVEELSTQAGWVREASKFGPLILLKCQ